jgi:hypothetical protein
VQVGSLVAPSFDAAKAAAAKLYRRSLVAAMNNLSAAQHSATLASALAWLWRRRCG